MAEAATEAIQTGVEKLIERSELEQIRLVRLHVEVAEHIPDEVSVEVGLQAVNAAGAEGPNGEPNQILVSFTHAARMRTPDGDDVATIEFTHLAHIRYTGEQPNEDVMQAWIMGNVAFMVYPYVRQTLQQACMQVGIPPIVLGYLKRDELIPRTITVVINKTQLVTSADQPQDPDDNNA